LFQFLEIGLKKNAVVFISFASGVLISVAMVHMYPTALKMDEYGASVCVLVGFLMFYVLNRMIIYHCTGHSSDLHSYHQHHHEESPLVQPIAEGELTLIPIIGIALHTFLEGAIYVITFRVGQFTGVATTVGIIIHQLPEAIFATTLLYRHGYNKWKAGLIAFLATGATAPLGSAVAIPLVNYLGGRVLGKLLAGCAGTLLYISAGHLLPHIEKWPFIHSILSLSAGVAAVLLIVLTNHQ